MRLWLAVLLPMMVGAHPNIEKIPPDDRKALEIFTCALLRHTAIGYSLLGEKPVSIHTFPVVARVPLPYSLFFTFGYPILFIG